MRTLQIKPTDVVAWIGAITGLASLGWNIYTKVSAGPVLRVSAFADMVQRPAPPNDPRFLRITVQNVGTAATTLTNCTFLFRPSRWHRFLRAVHLKKRANEQQAVLNQYQSAQLPQPLAAGTEWQALMEQDAGFAEWLNRDELHCAVWHSFARKPVMAKIIRTRKSA